MKKKIIKGGEDMKYKHIPILTLFITILLLCGLSTINAANNTISDTDTGGIDQGIIGTGDGDTLTLNPGTYDKSGEDHGITINKNITIKGNGTAEQVVIDAQENNRIFAIGNNVNVTFINLKFINGISGNVNGFGGAVWNDYINSKITFINCTFENNSALLHGGAVYSKGPTTITDCKFTNNSAKNYGGAIYNNQANMNVTGCNFINNKAGISGGAITDFRSKNMNVSNCNFTNNSAVEGGALETSGTNMTVSNCNFNNNNASDYGAAIVNGGTNVTVSSCNFTNNKAVNSGGAISTWGRNMTVSSCNFANNKAGISGGAIETSGDKMNITSCDFTNNNAANYGGAIYNWPMGNTSVSNSDFTNNNANYGGGIFNDGSMLVSGNTMSNNEANTLGNVIYNNGTMGILNLIYLSNSTVKTTKGSIVNIYATLTDDMGNTVTGQNISFHLNGINVANITSIEGKADFNYTVTQNPPATIPVNGDYAGHKGYSIIVKNGELLLLKYPTNNTVSIPGNLTVGDTVTIESKLTDENGNPLANQTIDFYIDGEYIGSAITDKNGIAKLNHTFKKAGNYKVSTKFDEIETHYGSNATNKTKVSKIPTITTIEKDGDKITVTLTDDKGNLLEGKKIILRDSKGRIIGIGITDENGQIIFTYKGDSVYFKASFNGDDVYKASSATLLIGSQDDEETKEIAKTNDNSVGTATMKDTGIPIIAILLVLLTTIGLVARRK